MRHSALRHPVAVLRTFLGLKQDEFAKLVGCSAATIQSIELGPQRMKLSEELATQISAVTGVSLLWLLEGDPSAPIVCELGLPYTKEMFELNQVSAMRPAGKSAFAQYFYVATLQKVHALFRGIEHTNQESQLLTYRINSFLDSLAKDLLEREPQDEEKFLSAQDPKNVGDVIQALKDAQTRLGLHNQNSGE